MRPAPRSSLGHADTKSKSAREQMTVCKTCGQVAPEAPGCEGPCGKHKGAWIHNGPVGVALEGLQRSTTSCPARCARRAPCKLHTFTPTARRPQTPELRSTSVAASQMPTPQGPRPPPTGRAHTRRTYPTPGPPGRSPWSCGSPCPPRCRGRGGCLPQKPLATRTPG